MTTSRKRRLAIGSALIVVTMGLGAFAWSKRPRELPPLETELPSFVEPNVELPRAPSNIALGVAIGQIDLAELDDHLRGLALACDDTGARALIERLRAKKQADLAAADSPDAVTGASITWRRSPREKNPQVRLSCEVDSLTRIDPTREPTPKGRALFVFDSPDHPLRHVSVRRNHTSRSAALRDLAGARALYLARFGEPTSTRGAMPEFEEELLDRIPPIAMQWRYADLLVEINLTDFGKTVSVDERVEVPWPVASDAPARPR